jgi:hypothetical protein
MEILPVVLQLLTIAPVFLKGATRKLLILKKHKNRILRNFPLYCKLIN